MGFLFSNLYVTNHTYQHPIYLYCLGRVKSSSFDNMQFHSLGHLGQTQYREASKQKQSENWNIDFSISCPGVKTIIIQQHWFYFILIQMLNSPITDGTCLWNFSVSFRLGKLKILVLKQNNETGDAVSIQNKRNY
jgi:hypothetical protein